MFQVDYDRHANCLNMRVEGFWTLDTVVLFAKEVGFKARQARDIHDDFNVLVLSLAFPVQANDVANLLTNIMRGGITLTSGRAAVVVGSQLNKAQAERTLVHPRVRIFLTIKDAKLWLAGQS